MEHITGKNPRQPRGFIVVIERRQVGRVMPEVPEMHERVEVSRGIEPEVLIPCGEEDRGNDDREPHQRVGATILDRPRFNRRRDRWSRGGLHFIASTTWTTPSTRAAS